MPQAANVIGQTTSQTQAQGNQLLQQSPEVQALMAKYSQGGISLKDALGSLKNISYSKGKIDPNEQGGMDEITRDRGVLDQLKAKGITNSAELEAYKAKHQGPFDLDGGLPGINDSTSQALKSGDASGYLDNLDKSHQSNFGDYSNEFQNMLATGAGTATRYGQDQLKNNDETYGKIQSGLEDATNQIGKYESNADTDREAMSGRDPSYGLTDGDYAAYGQGAGNIGRQFAGMEQNLSQSLADRGLASAPNGAAATGFSGLMGNKYEQLAGLQQQISQQRIATASDMVQKRAALNQSLLSGAQQQQRGLGALGEEALQSQYSRQAGGAAMDQQQLKDLYNMQMGTQTTAQNQNNEQFSQQQASKGTGAGDLAGALVGGAVGAATGGFGTGIGSTLGNAIGGGNKAAVK